MSEMPERKVLKNILSKLKAKTVISERRFKNSLEHNDKLFDTILKDVEKTSEKGSEVHKPIYQLVSRLADLFSNFSLEALGLIEEYELYIESLESYSTALDKTLWSAIEQAKKEAEEKIKQQKELMKRKSPESYRV